ncbi:acyltransferase [Acinetobacter indicus]|uniref:acyltransferase family protein n=1 Tax=Acinetobacter indicus TaxID=756892 RepID=UPI001FA6C044|nr:acyltransferase family protein [Acinetobacter indicus]UNW09663.1 acyltransferase [Acinetobacter indicus]
MMRNISLDLLKIFLAFCIIALHGKVFSDISGLLSFFTVNGFFRVGVPIFLIITGYYFFLINDIRVWLKRVTLLYLIWMVFYSLFYFEFSFSSQAIIKNMFFLIFGYHHLWYLAGTIAGGWLLYIAKSFSTRTQIFSALGLFTLGCLIQYLGNFHFLPKNFDSILNFYPVYRNFFTVCYPFLMFGFLIHKLNLTTKYKKIAPLAVLISLIILYVEVYINYFFISKTDPLDLMFSLALICPAIFIFVFNLNFQGEGKTLALLSTALYLIHPLFQNLLKPYNISSIEMFFVTVFLSCLASIILIALNKKIKVIL